MRLKNNLRRKAGGVSSPGFYLGSFGLRVSLLCLFLLAGIVSCGDKTSPQITGEIPSFPPLHSYRDIPGVTAEEIDAIEQVKKTRSSFVYAMGFGSEAFPGENGPEGFAARCCERLSELFDIPFKLRLLEWDELKAGLDSMRIDFSGEISPAQNTDGQYYMAGPAAPRLMKVMRIKGRTPRERLRCGLLKDAGFETLVTPYLKDGAELVFVKNENEARALLLNGTIDQYIDDETTEALFDDLDNVEVSTLYPHIPSPVFFTTANPELAPFVTVLEKYLEQGADSRLEKIWRLGKQDYLRWRFFNRLTDNERALLDEIVNSGSFVTAVLEPTRYPVSYYDEEEGRWRGAIPDVFEAIEKLTGMYFQILPSQDSKDPEALLRNGSVSLIAASYIDKKWESPFIWVEAPYLADYFALLSTLDYPDVVEDGINADKIGLIVPSLSSDVFRKMFPHYRNAKEYANILEACEGLEKGEINLVMTPRYNQIALYNYYQRPYFKTNYHLNQFYYFGFGFREDNATLASIFDKADDLINTNKIMHDWSRRTFNYRISLVEERQPYVKIVEALMVLLLVLLVYLVMRTRVMRRHLERIVQKRTSELEVQSKLAQSASIAKTQFLASMSHEIRTPMNAIIGMSDLMRIDNLDEQQTNYFSDIKRMAKSLLHIINDILDISKIEAGKLDIVPVHFNIGRLYADVSSLGTYSAKAKDISFYSTYDKSIPQILFADEGRMRQAVTNVLNNAIKYTKQGSVTFTLEKKERDGKVWIVFAIADTGIGIKKEDFSKLFNKFEQLDKEKNYGITGTGLGLPITKNLVEMMGGVITIDSEYGKGSVFTIFLPLVEGDPSKVEQIGAVGRLMAKEDVKVLVVDDNSINLSVALGFLMTHNIKADTATSGETAIEKLKSARYDLVFMDHMMPGMDGVEATKIIRTLDNPWLKEMPIIALSANAMAGVREEFIAAGMNDFLAKPIIAEALNIMLVKWLPSDKLTTAKEQPADKKVAVETGTAVSEKENTLLAELAAIEGFDTKTGLFHVGGNSTAFTGILRQFCTEFENYMSEIQTQFAEENWKIYAIKLHALKGVFATIGMSGLAKWAEKLELAGKAGDGETCKKETEAACAAMRVFKEQLEKTALMTKEDTGPKTSITSGELTQKLILLKDACTGGNSDTADALTAELRTMTFDTEIDAAIAEICSHAEALDYGAAIEQAAIVLEKLG